MFTFPVSFFKTSGGVGASTTWNPSDKAAGITLSSGNLHAATSAAAGDNIVRSTTSKTTGKLYYEWTFTTTNGQDLIGLANSTALLTSFLGNDNNGCGMVGGSGQFYTNGGTSHTGPALSSTQVCGIAIDFAAQRIWYRNASGAPTVWNTGGTDNPVTGLGGFDFSNITGPYFAADCLDSTSNGTGNFGQNAFAATIPSGFSVWG